MVIYLICIGNKVSNWVTSGYEEYAQRLPAHCRLQLIEIPLKKRVKTASLLRLQQEESEKMQAAIPVGAHVIALDERGQSWSSPQLAAQLAHWQQHFSQVALLVGGPEGLAADCLRRANDRWSLSAATLPHPLVRIVVAEQLYRAWTLLNGHPYHRA
jgi:23S rRNA (pseudouridine1915-N3)-methyltransferase